MQLKKTLVIFAVALLSTLGAQAQDNAPQADAVSAQTPGTPAVGLSDVSEQVRNRVRRRERGLSNLKTPFVPAGQWVFGGTLSYSTHSNDSYKLLVVEGINSEGYTFKISPLVGYSLLPNSIVGVRFAYSRSLTDLSNASMNIGEGDGALNFNFDYYYALKHSYDVVAIWRQYIPLGRNKRFALFSEFQLALGGAQSKYAEGSPVRGTHSTSFNISAGVNPGVVAFVTNNMALELNVGVLGFNYSSTRQVHNQVETGETSSSVMNFSINIFSIGVGVAFYL